MAKIGMRIRWRASLISPGFGVTPPTDKSSQSSMRSAPPRTAAIAASSVSTLISSNARFFMGESGLVFFGRHASDGRSLLGSRQRPPTLPGKIRKDNPTGNSAHTQEQNSQPKSVKHQIADAEQGRVHHDAAQDPVGKICRKIAHLRQLRAKLRDGLPAVNTGMYALVEGDELFGWLGLGHERSDEPQHRGDARGDQRRFGHNYGAVSFKLHFRQREGKHRGANRRDDFAPSIDPPPVPAQDQHGAGTGANAQYDLPAFRDGSQPARHVSADQHQHNREHLAHIDVVMLGCLLYQKS